MQKIDNKQPWEVYPIGVDFSLNMEDTEVINSSLSEVKVYEKVSGEDVSGTMVEGDVYVVDSTKLAVIIKGGVSGTKYKLSYRAYITSTKKLEEDLELKVID